MHGLFLTYTQNDVIRRKHTTAHTKECTCIQLYINLTPCFSFPRFFYTCQPCFLLTWRTSFTCSWCECPSFLVPGLLSTAHPLLLHPPQDTSQIKLHIYIDDINNISRLLWYKYIRDFVTCGNKTIVVCGSTTVRYIFISGCNMFIQINCNIRKQWCQFSCKLGSNTVGDISMSGSNVINVLSHLTALQSEFL
jgi:hypothetical protein